MPSSNKSLPEPMAPYHQATTLRPKQNGWHFAYHIWYIQILERKLLYSHKHFTAVCSIYNKQAVQYLLHLFAPLKYSLLQIYHNIWIGGGGNAVLSCDNCLHVDIWAVLQEHSSLGTQLGTWQHEGNIHLTILVQCHIYKGFMTNDSHFPSGTYALWTLH